MKLFKIRTLIFSFLALLFLMVSAIAAPPENQGTLSSAPAAMTSILPSPAATYYGSHIRIYFPRIPFTSINDLDIYFWGWYPPWYYPIPWWFCYYNYPWSPLFRSIDLTYNPYSPYYPYQPMSIYRWWNGSLNSGYPLYFGWRIYWPRFPFIFMRWTSNNVPVGPYIPVLAYNFGYIGPWLGSGSTNAQSSAASTPSTAVNLTLSNDQNGVPETIDSLQIGYSTKMYQLQDLTWNKLSTDSNITWGPIESNIHIAPGTSRSYPNMPASAVGMLYRVTLHSDLDPSQVVEYIVQYSTGAWSTEFPYRANDIVTYGDIYYKCMVNHTSAPSLAPPNSSIWIPMSEPVPPVLPSPPPQATTIPVNPGPTLTPLITPTPSGPSPTPTKTPTPSPVVTPTATKTPTPGGANLALGKPITANSYTQTYVATMANDGNVTTYWQGTASSYPNMLTVNLGSLYSVNNIKVKLPTSWGARIQTFSVLGSTDNVTFNTIVNSAVYSFDPSANSNTVTITFAGTNARYIRLYFTANSGATAGQVAEFEVYSPTI